MTLTKAIEIVDLNIKEAGKKMPPDCKDALKLCSEAAKALKEFREDGWLPGHELLPDEAPET